MEFRLSMVRQEIENDLGLAPETIIRLIGQFEAAGLTQAHNKTIRIHDLQGL